MLAAIGTWVARRRSIRRRWQADARALADADMHNAYYEAQRRAARARVRNDRAAFYHWAKVAAEVARIAPLAGMDIDVVRAVVAEEERHRPTVGCCAACALRPAREALAAAYRDAKPGANDGLPAAPLPDLLFATFGSCPECVGRESNRRERVRAREEEWKKPSWKS